MAAFAVGRTFVRASLSRPQIRLGAMAAFIGLFVAHRVRMHRKVRKNRRELQALSDRMLADLGLSRLAIERGQHGHEGAPKHGPPSAEFGLRRQT